jgi:hypothetical protein
MGGEMVVVVGGGRSLCCCLCYLVALELLVLLGWTSNTPIEFIPM